MQTTCSDLSSPRFRSLRITRSDAATSFDCDIVIYLLSKRQISQRNRNRVNWNISMSDIISYNNWRYHIIYMTHLLLVISYLPFVEIGLLVRFEKHIERHIEWMNKKLLPDLSTSVIRIYEVVHRPWVSGALGDPSEPGPQNSFIDTKIFLASFSTLADFSSSWFGGRDKTVPG